MVRITTVTITMVRITTVTINKEIMLNQPRQTIKTEATTIQTMVIMEVTSTMLPSTNRSFNMPFNKIGTTVMPTGTDMLDLDPIY
jgi:hypothetical protein